MIVNESQELVAEKLRHEAEANPVAQAVSAAVKELAEAFEVETEGAGLGVRACGFLPNGVPNRARLKIFSPKPGHTLVFFYKRSLVPYSRDRYSYGGIDLRESELSEQDVAEWLHFLTSGFHPDQRPARFRRAFPYEIPE
jgi:hypothetical protein